MRAFAPIAPVAGATSSKEQIVHLLTYRAHLFTFYLNTRYTAGPNKFAAADFVHRYTTPSGDIYDMTVDEMTAHFEERFEMFPDYRFEILDTTVYLEESEKPTYATVWQTLLVHDGETPGERERVAIYSWRKETDKYGVTKWVWWKQECPAMAAITPF